MKSLNLQVTTFCKFSVFFTIKKWPIASTLRFRLMPHAATFLTKKITCLRRFIWHGLCSVASIGPFARPSITFAVARRRCLRPRGMTAYLHAFNLAERVLFVLSYEQQIPVFRLHPIWPNTSSSSCCLSSMNSP